MIHRRPWLLIVCLVLAAGPVRADDWPVPRGPSREPQPFRYEPKTLQNVPKEFLDDAQACVIYSGTTHLIEPDGTVEAITHEITRLNSRKGIEKLGEYRAISFDPAYEKLTLNEARVIKANGKIIPIEPKHVQLRDLATDFQVYDQDKQLVISFPNLQVGDAYEVKWTVRGRNREFNGDFFARYTFGDDTHPVLRDEFRVGVPKNKTLKHASVNGKVEPKITSFSGGKLYAWSVTNHRQLPRDEDRPSKEELRLQLVVSTFASWEAVGRWKQKVRAECWRCEPDVRKIIDEVTRGKKTPLDKAKALTYWVRGNIRYLSRGPGGLGYTPHLPHQVLSNLYGDCKDQAQLLAVMLREIGLPVWLVTLGTLDDGQIHPAVPSPWGSHAILLTKIDGKEYWIDTTVSLAAWDFLPRSDRDRQTYITQDDRLQLVKTPAFTWKDYRIEQTTRVSVLADGTSRCQREAIYHGNSAWSKRERWFETPPGERRRAVSAELQDAHSKARLFALKIDDKVLLDLDKPVHAEMDFEIPKHFSGETSREGSLTDSTVWTWFLGYNVDLDRQLPLVLPTPFESIHRYVVELPLAFRADALPGNRDIKSPWGFFRLKVSTAPDDPRRVELDMHMRLEKTRVEKRDFAEFVRFQDDVTKAYRVWLTLRPSSEIADAPRLEKLLAGQKPTDAQAAKVLARLYIDHARWQDARRVLTKAAAWFPTDKSVWDLRVQTADDLEEEESLYRAMVKQFPSEAAYRVELGAICVRNEEHKEASDLLAPLTSHATLAIAGAAHYQLARNADRQKDAAAALKHLKKALLADPTTLATNEAMHFKARVHEKLDQLKEAIDTLQTLLLAQPAERDALEHLVRLELKAGQRAAALDHLRRYTVEAGKDLSSLVKAADLHLQMNRLEDAFELASRAREVGFQAKAQRILGLVALSKNDFAQAVFHLERCDLDHQALAGLIRAQLHQGDLDGARRRVETIRRLESASKELLGLEKDVLALAARRDQYMQQAKPAKEQRAARTRLLNRYLCAERGLAERWPREQVERLLNEAAAEATDFAPLLALRGWVLLEKGQLRQALADADAALKLHPGEARAYLVRGRVYLEQGRSKEAVNDLRRATELSQRRDALALHWLAAALLELGRTREMERVK